MGEFDEYMFGSPWAGEEIEIFDADGNCLSIEPVKAGFEWEVIDKVNDWWIAKNLTSGILYKLSSCYSDNGAVEIGKTYGFLIRECQVVQIVVGEQVGYRRISGF